MLTKVFDTLILFFKKAKEFMVALLNATVPVVFIVILLEVLVGVKTGVLARLVKSLSTVGVSGSVITVILAVGFVLWIERKK